MRRSCIAEIRRRTPGESVFRFSRTLTYTRVKDCMPYRPKWRQRSKKLQPYRRADPGSHPLWILSELNNVDKHRSIHFVSHFARTPRLVLESSTPGSWSETMDDGPLEDGTVLARLFTPLSLIDNDVKAKRRSGTWTSNKRNSDNANPPSWEHARCHRKRSVGRRWKINPCLSERTISSTKAHNVR